MLRHGNEEEPVPRKSLPYRDTKYSHGTGIRSRPNEYIDPFLVATIGASAAILFTRSRPASYTSFAYNVFMLALYETNEWLIHITRW